MPKLYVTCGISGSGKSYWANEYKKSWKAFSTMIISTDDIRKFLWGNEEDQQQPEKVFDVAYKSIEKFLSDGWDVIFDATNLSARDRKKIVKRYRALADALICVDFGNDVPRALKNQELRARKVPTEVIERQAKKYKKPSYDEGWDVIMF